jgi:nucleoside-diphosphate kinase
MIKPDGVQRGLIGEVIARFEKKGYKLISMKYQVASKDMVETHYEDLKGKGFFDGLVTYITSGPVVQMVWEGANIIEASRKLIGATNPINSEPGTIRGDYAIDVGRNIIHGSDLPESATKEIAHWFTEEEQAEWVHHSNDWTYE